MEAQIEEWRTIVIDEEEINYEVSSCGRIRHAKKKNILKVKLQNGKQRPCLYKGADKIYKYVHILVAEAFIPNPSQLPFVLVKNQDHTNLCVENLKWANQEECAKVAAGAHKEKARDKQKVNKEDKRAKPGEDIGQPIPGYDGYRATREGRIYSDKSKQWMTLQQENDNLCIRPAVPGKKKGPKVYIQQLVALTYIDTPENIDEMELCHVNKNKLNNHVSNLKWEPKRSEFAANRRKRVSDNVEHDLEGEEWRRVKIDEKEVNYLVSSKGRVRNYSTKQILKLQGGRGNYLRAHLSVNSETVSVVAHVLVACAFIPIEKWSVKLEVDHKDTNRQNNIVSNLEWVTHSENVKRSYMNSERRRRRANPISAPVGKPIPGYNSYLATKDGAIYSMKSKRILLPTLLNGYHYVSLSVDGQEYKRLIHRLVALTYLLNPHGKLQVNHQNGTKIDNFLGNLEWTTQSENIQHAVVNGHKPTKGGVQKLTKSGKVLQTFATLVLAAEHIGLDKANISRCCLRKQQTCGGYGWKYVEQQTIYL
jgi:hypothetical protein